MKIFLVCSDINNNLAMELTTFFVECKLNNEEAVLLINSKSGTNAALKQIISAYKSSGVHLIAIGMGKLCNCSSAIFCMADERILLPETEFSLHPDLKDYYEKTGITPEIFNQKCSNNTCWELSESEIQKYNITNRSAENWIDIVMQTLEKDEKEFSNYFPFNSDFTSETASNFVIFLIYCKLNAKDAFAIINSRGGSIMQLKAILNAYQASGVHLTMVGTGSVGSCAAALFCMADERILAPGTTFLLHHANTTFDENTYYSFPILKHEYERLQNAEKILVDAYTAKTNIPREVLEEKCTNGADWSLNEDEIQRYDITTSPSENWTDILANAMKK